MRARRRLRFRCDRLFFAFPSKKHKGSEEEGGRGRRRFLRYTGCVNRGVTDKDDFIETNNKRRGELSSDNIGIYRDNIVSTKYIFLEKKKSTILGRADDPNVGL